MKAIAIDRNGGTDVLQLRDLPTPEPSAGEALVRLEASGVNFVDVYMRKGTYRAPHLPLVLGREGAGVVEALGSGAQGVAVGDRVAFVAAHGAYAEYACVSAAGLVRVPAGVTSQDAAALMLQGMTAHFLAKSTFALGAGHVALVHAGAGGVGLLLTQLAKRAGATVITTVSTPEKAALSKGAGADHVIDYTQGDFAAAARDITGGRGVDVVYDSVGATTYERSLDALRRRGTFVLFGGSSGPVPPIDLQTLNAKGSLYATRPKLDDYIATRDELMTRAAELFADVASGTLTLRIEHTYPLAEAARAHTDLEARATTGKLLLLP